MEPFAEPLALEGANLGANNEANQANWMEVPLLLELDRASRVPLYRQIYRQLAALILGGQLPEGFRLPSERELARRLGVNRTTVVAAYQELSADGLVEGHVGRGTIVIGRRRAGRAGGGPPLLWSGLVQARLHVPWGPLLQRVGSLSARPGVISFASGILDPTQSPHLKLEQAVVRALSRPAWQLLEDSPTEGWQELREEIARRLAGRGCDKLSARCVLIVSGSQQGIYLVAQLLLRPGDAVLVENPTYLGALEVFYRLGARIIGIPVDAEGMQVEAAQRALAGGQVRLIYVNPNYHNPTGTTMPTERRLRLLELARRYQVPILEDDLYGELSFEGAPPPSIRALDQGGYVVYLGGLSPLLGPGLRLGWLVVPRALVPAVVAMRKSIDLHHSNLLQAVALELLRDGSLDAHIRWLRHACAARRDEMLAELSRLQPLGLQAGVPGGGLHIWCSLPEGCADQELLEEAAPLGVTFMPGQLFFVDGSSQGFIRLNFAAPGPGQIPEGVRRLGEALRALQAKAVGAEEQAGRPLI
jgi:2-aminoadipate transaminase